MKNFYRSNILLALVLALVICLVAMDIILFSDQPGAFWISLPLLILVSGLTLGKLLQIRLNEYAYYDRLDKSIDNANHKALMSFPLPVALVNDERRILWCNDGFTNAFFRPSEDESSLDVLTTEHLSLFAGDGREVRINGRWYRVTARDVVYSAETKDSSRRLIQTSAIDSANKVNILYFTDITGFKSLQEEYRRSKPVVLIISVDNYDDALGTGRESDKTFVSVQIDRLLEEYFSGMNAVLRKITGDKFIVVVEERFVQKMIDERVKLLEQARQIKVNDRTVVTLSIGVGRTAAIFPKARASHGRLWIKR